MKRMRRHRLKRETKADIDVTPFMNLMIALTPVLLMSIVFTHSAVIDIDFPSNGSAESAAVDDLHLEVEVKGDALIVQDGRGGVIKNLPSVDGHKDFAKLSLVMQEVKRRVPDKRDVMILLEPGTDYQTVVSVMDSVRSYHTMRAASYVEAELFPVISLGDTPVG